MKNIRLGLAIGLLLAVPALQAGYEEDVTSESSSVLGGSGRRSQEDKGSSPLFDSDDDRSPSPERSRSKAAGGSDHRDLLTKTRHFFNIYTDRELDHSRHLLDKICDTVEAFGPFDWDLKWGPEVFDWVAPVLTKPSFGRPSNLSQRQRISAQRKGALATLVVAGWLVKRVLFGKAKKHHKKHHKHSA